MAAITSKNILLVDDNPLYLKLLSQAFAKAGFACQVAHSAHEALLYLQNQAPDIILSDYEMPEMNGLEFRRSILAVQKLKDIPFVFLTGFDDETVMYTGLDLQAIDYVKKDTPVDVIIAKINNLLHTVSTQRQLSELEIKKTVAALNIKTVPVSIPSVSGITIDFWHRSYQDIPGGDFIDFIDTNSQHVYIVLGDVMGKKWKAWFYTFTYLSYIRAAVRFSALGQDASGAAILQKINEVIYYDEGLRGILSSVSLICINKQTGQLTYTGAGDLPLLHYSAHSLQLSQVNSTGLLLGLLPEGNYTEQEIILAEGDQLFMFTDGLIDIAADKGSKSDYNLFAAKLTQHLHSGRTFEEFKINLEQQLAALVDDSSIIFIHKPLLHA